MKRLIVFCAFFLALSVIVVFATGQKEQAATKPVTLTWLAVDHGASPRTAAREDHLKDYMSRNPNVKIDLTISPFAQYLQKVQISLSQGALDMLQLDPTQIPQLVLQDVLLPVEDYIDGKDDYLPIVLQVASHKGHIYSWSQMESSQVLFYNVEMMDGVGIKPPTKPADRWTWNEFKDVAVKLTADKDSDGSNDVWGFSVRQAARPYILWAFMQSMGVPAVSDDYLSVKGYLDHPDAVEAYQFYGDLYNKWKVAAKSPIQDAFGIQKAATYLAGPWVVPGFKKYTELKWDGTYFPYFKTPVTPASSWHYGIAKISKHPKEAADFYNDAMSTDISVDFYRRTMMLPTKKSVIDKLGKEFTEDKIAAICWYELNNTAVIRPRTPAYSEYEDAFGRALQDIILGANAKERLQEAVEEIERAMAKYR